MMLRKVRMFYLVGVFLLIYGCGPGSPGGPGAGKRGGFPSSVVTAAALEEKIEERISLVGNLQADESVEIRSQISGLIEQIGFEEGQVVKAGQMLFAIDAAKLKALLLQAQSALQLAQTTFNRLTVLIKGNAISQQEYDQAQSDLESRKAEIELIHAQLKESVITASFDGIMGERKVSLGQFVSAGMSLSYLIKQDPIKAEFHVPERVLGQLKVGQNIEFKVAAYPKESFKGEVYFIDPQVEEMSRTVLVKARLPNPDNKLRQGMFANLNLIVNVRDKALVVLESAVILKGDDAFVYIVDDQNQAQIRPVQIGIRMDGKAEILQGIHANDQVIVEGHQKIGPGSPVSVQKPAESLSSL